MSGREFVVPCAVCGGSASVHGVGAHEGWSEVARREHAYTPDEHSVEWAALKLREAADVANIYLTMLAGRLPALTATGCEVVASHIDLVREAIQLADAAGIKAITTPTTTTP